MVHCVEGVPDEAALDFAGEHPHRGIGDAADVGAAGDDRGAGDLLRLALPALNRPDRLREPGERVLRRASAGGLGVVDAGQESIELHGAAVPGYTADPEVNM